MLDVIRLIRRSNTIPGVHIQALSIRVRPLLWRRLCGYNHVAGDTLIAAAVVVDAGRLVSDLIREVESSIVKGRWQWSGSQ